jgi:hypothetical protein
MKVKETVIKESLHRIKKRVAEIDYLLNVNPVSEICALRIEASKIIKENKENYKEIAKLLKPLIVKEREMFQLAEKRLKSIDLVSEKVRLSNEEQWLNQELYSINNPW